MSNPQEQDQPEAQADVDDLDLALEEAIDEVLDESAAKPGNNAPPVDELTVAKRTAAEAEQRALRAHAELENVRKRMRREQQEERKYATLPLVRDLLPAIDNLERAMGSIATEECPPGLIEGVQMVASQIIDVLGQHACTRVAPKGQPFDPMHHEAVAQQPSDEYEQGMVSEVLQVGYMIHDRVIRPAQVMVSTGPAAAPQEETD